jgi:hypothetical protein
MKRISYILITVVIIIVIILIFTGNNIPKNVISENQPIKIFPDYSGITIPTNIAPMNFRIEENAEKYLVSISNSDGKKLTIKSSEPSIYIPVRKWKNLLKECAGKDITIEIFLKKSGQKWTKYPALKNHIAEENIDNHIVFRHINAGYILWEKMGIYQRNLENFDEKPILLNDRTDRNCMNCHSFGNYDPKKMMIHMRRPPSGTLIYNNGEAKLFNTATNYTMSAGVYPSWHPNGKLIAYSVNKIEQKFHSAANGTINVYDKASDLVIYDIEKNIISTTPSISTKNLENMPAWSPVGDYLYYISAPPYNKDEPNAPVKYDLIRISFNTSNNTWGIPDTLLTSAETGMSITFPEISPDGNFLVFCMADQGYFTVFNQSSDLYLMDLKTKAFSKLALNSNHVESFHSWSSNGRWLLFISKRLDGLYSQVYFSYIDKNGKASKPFILPQKNPDFYSTYTLNYNRPVFVKGEVSISAEKLSQAAFKKAIDVKFDPSVDVDALSGATKYEKKEKNDVKAEHTN